MFDVSFTSPAVTVPELTTVYWVAMILGGGLLLISTLAGGDADAEIDMDLDVDIDTSHAHAASLATWFSMQFAVFFLAMFGLVGVTMTHLSARGSAVVLISALVGGLLVGQGAHQVIRKLRSTSGDSTPKPKDYVNKLARVTISLTKDSKGEIALRVGRSDRYIPALARHAQDTFSHDQQVGVVAYRDGVAEVVSRKEFEFLSNKNSRTIQNEGDRS